MGDRVYQETKSEHRREPGRQQQENSRLQCEKNHGLTRMTTQGWGPTDLGVIVTVNGELAVCFVRPILLPIPGL